MDLAALPLEGGGTLNLLPALNTYRFLDVIISDDTAVDYMTLTVETAESTPTPEPASLLVWSVLGLAGAGGCVWRRRRAR